ncbi:hypothetical protein D1BOALGB6SA_4922 [Olavius sp. associated proteobacterium Delta 1]|nr:hypothetical protein D1BOALGB6SA_4922 [Olavius sp. associated proteobacterium Delta 1]
MKFENLIWIIIFLVYVVWLIIKKVRAASKTSEQGVAKRLPAWKEKLNKFMSQVQQMAAEGEPLEDLGPIRKEISSERIEQAIEKPPLPKIKPALVKADAESAEPAVSGKEILPKDLEFGIQDLRKAVIWSEILAPPLALRDK